jgi:murein DD-endopeptidase MepM/ murein hydrolase activator NlpD
VRAPSAAGFRITSASVGPRRAYVAGIPIAIRFRFATTDDTRRVRLTIDVVNRATGGVARRFVRSRAQPGRRVTLRWSGFIDSNTAARDSRYVVRVRAARSGERARSIGSFTLHGHFFPIRGPHHDRGTDSHGSGAFGTPRSGGRVHEGFDVTAACGTPVDAARGGRVVLSRYDPVLYGNYVIIRSAAEHHDYWYAHLLPGVRVHRGDDVLTGQRIGRVGETGNARTVGCHLHFELHVGGRPVDPAPSLHRWDTWS